ncbi:MAG: DUF2339 domain-containing protein [Kiritimatiellae bacterium]|nr:DUF2339 domain-containing protein [Kiritimatiellia bacterium]
MEALLLLVIPLFLLGMPILVIVTLVKVSHVESQIDRLVRDREEDKRMKGLAKAAKAEKAEEAAKAAPNLPAENREPPRVDARPAPAPSAKAVAPLAPGLVRQSRAAAPAEPTAYELFWMRIEDWFAVRGDFAPNGMTHEFAFATRWLVRIGVVLLVGATAYFVKLSIDRGWMGPTGRVAATLFWGAVGCVAGSWLVKKDRYALLGHAVAALGVVALYLGFGLGHRYFDPPVIASPAFAFAALAAVTLCAGVMSVYLRSAHIAVLGLVGGYLVPVVAGRDSGFPLGLDAYLLVLNLGAFYVARMRKWSALDFLASMLAVWMCAGWCASHGGGRAAVWVNFAFLSAVHAIYMASVVVGARSRGKAGNALAWAGLAVNACCYFGWLAVVFRETFSDRAMGLVLLALVAAYLAVATLAIRRGWADRATIDILLFFALAFLAVAPLMIFGRPWCVASWSALAVVSVEAEARTNQRILGVVACLLLAAAALVGVFNDALYAYCGSCVALKGLSGGEWTGAFALRLVRLWTLPVAAVLVARRLRIGPLVVAALVLAFLFFTGEARVFGWVFLPALKLGSVSVAWLLAAFAGLWAGIVRRSRVSRTCALSLLGVAVAKILLFDTEQLATSARVGVFALAGALLIVGAFLYLKFKERFVDRAP